MKRCKLKKVGNIAIGDLVRLPSLSGDAKNVLGTITDIQDWTTSLGQHFWCAIIWHGKHEELAQVMPIGAWSNLLEKVSSNEKIDAGN